MRTLYFSFIVRIQSLIDGRNQFQGPLFTRWLPDGKNDAIQIDLGHPSWKLCVWFSRYGELDKDGFIKYARHKEFKDLDALEKQGVLNAGDLEGEIEISNVTNEQYTAIVENKSDDADYKNFAKQMIRMIQLPLNRLVNILRNCYGQYWVDAVADFDGRKETLKDYFRYLSMRWRTDVSAEWSDFVPTLKSAPIVIDGLKLRESFPELLSQHDWNVIGQLMKEKFDPSPASALLIDAHRLLDNGELEHALVRGVTALEVAIDNFFDQVKRDYSEEAQAGFSFFDNLNNPQKIAMIAGIKRSITPEIVDRTLRAVSTRNDYVHERTLPSQIHHEIDKYRAVESDLQGLFHFVSDILPGPPIRFPSAKNGNSKAGCPGDS